MRGVGVGDAAELVVGVLEEVGVDRADAQAQAFGVRAQLAEVVDGVPGEVQRDGAGAAPVRRWTSAASSRRSNTLRGRPACVNTAKRVPESP